MKKFFLFICILSFIGANAQTTTSTKPKKKSYKKYTSKANYNGFDSATYFYNLGWDNYKMDSLGNDRFGPARYYWEKASIANGKWESKNASLFRLGLMQQNGEGVDVNLQMAMNYFLKASGNNYRFGDVDAIKNIGTLYENGTGVDQNFSKALDWYIKAKRAGHQSVDEDITRLKDRLKK